MTGFDEPPVTLPKVPDTSLMHDLYEVAYIDVQPPDMQYYDSDAPYLRNLPTTYEASKNASVIRRDRLSKPEFWMVNITSSFQPEHDEDLDPLAPGESVTLGTTMREDETDPTEPIRRFGVLIYLETIRDYCFYAGLGTILVEQVVVVHETGHQFELKHQDDYMPEPTDQNPLDDCIMSDLDFPNWPIPPVMAFSPYSRAKLRSAEYPCRNSN